MDESLILYILKYSNYENQNIIGVTSKDEEIHEFARRYPKYQLIGIEIVMYDFQYKQTDKRSLFEQPTMVKFNEEYKNFIIKRKESES